MTRHSTPAPPQITTHPLASRRLLQRQCPQCGQHTSDKEHCVECQKQDWNKQQQSILPTPAETPTNQQNSSHSHPPKTASLDRDRQDFSQIPTHSQQASNPTRLTIAPAKDRYEQEADQIADWIVQRASRTTTSIPTIQRKATSLQRACKPCKEKLQRLATGESEITPTIETALSNLRCSGGQPLPLPVRRVMEPQFGQDFRHIRIHTSTQAAQLARSVQARAFTVGQDIVFGTDQFRPQTTAGQWLLAHELTHTLQQADPSNSRISGALLQRVPASCTLDPDLPPQPTATEFQENPQINAIRESIFEAKPTVLKRGASGVEVAFIQRILLNQVCEGYNRDALRQELADQVFGKTTRQAVKQFQQTYPDAIGNPLREDGIVGPYTLGTMDYLVDLTPIPPPSPAEAEGECYGTAEDGPGEFEFINEPTLLAWDLRNFDIAQHFVKTEHRDFLETEVVPQLQANLDTYRSDSSVVFGIIGQASATGSFAYNQALSERRAACVEEALEEKGLKPKPGDFDYISGIGKIPAEFKLIFKRASGKPLTKKDIEDREQRKVRIGVVFQRRSDECTDQDKTNKSTQFIAKVACDSARSARVNIADTSGGQPIYREFIWTQFPTYGSNCQFSLSNIDPNAYQKVTAFNELQLARQNPTEPKALSDFAGTAVVRSDPTSQPPSQIFADGRFSLAFPGSWYPSGCETDFAGGIPDIPGLLTPIGPVKCGAMPAPPVGNCFLPAECDRTAGATRFTAYLTRGSLEVLPEGRLKRFIQFVVGALTGDITVGLLAIGTLNAQGAEEINRVLVFVGPDIRRECEETGIQPIALGNTVDTGSKLFHLATDLPDYPTPATDFWNLAATLKMLPGSNKDELAINGFGTFTFVGPRCNDGAREISGRIFPLLPVLCGDISIPSIVRDILELRPCDEDDCSDSHLTCADNKFTVKIGRADLADLPLYGKQLAQQYGCEVEAGFVYIGTQNLDPPIYRQFFFIQKIGDCQFTIDRKTLETRTLEPMKLATKDPDQAFAPSDFTGLSQLLPAAWTWITDKPAVVGLGLPGTWDAKCPFFNQFSLLGALSPIPLMPVECGQLPDPPHTPRNTNPDDCDRFKQTYESKINRAIGRVKRGDFDSTLSKIGKETILLVDKPLNELRTGEVRDDELAVGLNWNNEVIVMFLDFEVVKTFRDATHFNVIIKMLSTPCAFSLSRTKVLFLRQNCQEGLRKNKVGTLKSIPELEENKQKQQEDNTQTFTASSRPPDENVT